MSLTFGTHTLILSSSKTHHSCIHLLFKRISYNNSLDLTFMNLENSPSHNAKSYLRFQNAFNNSKNSSLLQKLGSNVSVIKSY